MSDKPPVFSRVQEEAQRPRDEAPKYVAPPVKKSALEKIQEAYREGPTGGLPKLSPEALASFYEGSTGDLPKAPDYQNEILSNYREGPTGVLPKLSPESLAFKSEGPTGDLPIISEAQTKVFSQAEPQVPSSKPIIEIPNKKHLERSDSVSSISSTITNASSESFSSETNPLIRSKSESDLQKHRGSTSPVKDVPVKDGKYWQNLVTEQSDQRGKGGQQVS